MKNDVFRHFCTGCGLCHSIKGTKFDLDQKGFPYPNIDLEIEFCMDVCPCGNKSFSKQIANLGDSWGKYKSVYLGWSSNEKIRYEASSGGIITSVCIYLLETGIVDGVIQTKAGNTQIDTKTIVSRTKEDVLSCMGSRYTISSPLYAIREIVSSGEKYAFVGKPCDISALKLYLENDDALSQQIVILISFFCAGQPSRKANEELLKKLDSDTDKCKTLTYRGNGWPGYATANNKDGRSKSVTYTDSWGKILGRDIRPFCRFCMDGIGLMADIACGDAWFSLFDGSPDFSEHDGRNIIFTRTEQGQKIISDMVRDQAIEVYTDKEYNDSLRFIQRYQYERKNTMVATFFAMKMFRKDTPYYTMKDLFKYTKISIKELLRRFFGVCKRVVNGKL